MHHSIEITVTTTEVCFKTTECVKSINPLYRNSHDGYFFVFVFCNFVIYKKLCGPGPSTEFKFIIFYISVFIWTFYFELNKY